MVAFAAGMILTALTARRKLVASCGLALYSKDAGMKATTCREAPRFLYIHSLKH
jgi:hypothetical protein